MLIKRCLFSRYYLCRNQYLSNDIVVCSCYVFEMQVAWLFFSLHLYTVICYLCIPRRCHIIIPKDTQKFMACIPQDAKNDLLIDLKMFCRMSCSCDFCGCPCGWFLKTHISFSIVVLYKKIYVICLAHKGPSMIFQFRIFVFLELGLIICSHAR